MYAAKVRASGVNCTKRGAEDITSVLVPIVNAYTAGSAVLSLRVNFAVYASSGAVHKVVQVQQARSILAVSDE